jgi:GTP cyclohydrolase III
LKLKYENLLPSCTFNVTLRGYMEAGRTAAEAAEAAERVAREQAAAQDEAGAYTLALFSST